MSPLDVTSDDVLHAILDECGQREFYQLSLVNKRLHMLVESRLYSTIESTWTHIKDPITWLILRSVLSRPVLASKIRKLVFRTDTSYFTSEDTSPGKRLVHDLPVKIAPPVDGEDLMKVLAVIWDSNIPHEESELWTEEIKAGSIDAPLAVLMSLLPNLASIFFHEDFTRTTICFSIILKNIMQLNGLAGESKIISEFKTLQRVDLPGIQHITTNGAGITVQRNPQSIHFVLLLFHSPGIRIYQRLLTILDPLCGQLTKAAHQTSPRSSSPRYMKRTSARYQVTVRT
ncbi:hypothetical protein VTL71DRAFT_15768 [Oculimacula yallundae]|uniref:F-box domain-containing protein n=1 Tax=Oculimacula yallundae TaxID=86028 RepID=A0ABR4CCL7_9HELO